jgi:hypothetical protein
VLPATVAAEQQGCTQVIVPYGRQGGNAEGLDSLDELCFTGVS